MKTYDQFKKELSEDTPANSMGGGFSVSSASSNPNPNMAGYDPLLFGGKKIKRKRSKFAGAEVFKITSEDYSKSVNGRKKWQRWNKNMNMEDFDNQEIRTYCHRHPGKAVIIQDENSGIMSYLIPPLRKVELDEVEDKTLDSYMRKVHAKYIKGQQKSPKTIKKIQGFMKAKKKLDEIIRVRINRPIGVRVADIGPGGKQYNVKTDAEWDKQEAEKKKEKKKPTTYDNLRKGNDK